MSSTGSRCSIYQKIDDLAEAQTVAVLVAKLQPILEELAYYAVTGEAAVQETREEWHTEFTDRLYGEMGTERASAVAARELKPASAPTAPRGPEVKRSAASGSRGKGGARGRGASANSGGGYPDSEERLPPPPPSNRPKPSDLPASLRAILDGSHPSLTEKDYEH